jgi:hypothetical protein
MTGPVSTKSEKSVGQAEEHLPELAQRPTPSGSYTSVMALQRAAGNQAVGQLLQPNMNDVPPIVRDALNSGSGQPLDPTVRESMESRFGHDFSQVRVHTDARAAESARALRALAYAAGNHIVFGAGRFRPDKLEGQHLLEHELVHVLQQRTAGNRNVIQCADDWSLNELLTYGPTIREPEPNQLAKALESLNKANASPTEYEIIVQKIVTDFQFTHLAKHDEPLSNESLWGACEMGRDVPAISLATLVRESPAPIQIFRFQAAEISEKAQHGFAVIVFPDGTRFLIDPTFSQFMSVPGQALRMEAELYTANILRESAEGRQMAKDLINRGYIILDKDGKNAKLYAKGLGVPDNKLPEIAGRLMTGEGASSKEIVGQGRGTIERRGNLWSTEEYAKYLREDIESLGKGGKLKSAPQGTLQKLKELLARIRQATKAKGATGATPAPSEAQTSPPAVKAVSAPKGETSKVAEAVPPAPKVQTPSPVPPPAPKAVSPPSEVKISPTAEVKSPPKGETSQGAGVAPPAKAPTPSPAPGIAPAPVGAAPVSGTEAATPKAKAGPANEVSAQSAQAGKSQPKVVGPIRAQERSAQREAGAAVIGQKIGDVLEVVGDVGIRHRIEEELRDRQPAIAKFQSDFPDEGVLIVIRLMEPKGPDPEGRKPRQYVGLYPQFGGRTQSEAQDRWEQNRPAELWDLPPKWELRPPIFRWFPPLKRKAVD